METPFKKRRSPIVVILICLFTVVFLLACGYILFSRRQASLLEEKTEEYPSGEYRELVEEEIFLLDGFYFSDQVCEEITNETSHVYMYRQPCEIFKVDRESRTLEALCQDEDLGNYPLASNFLLECLRGLGVGVTRETLYARAREEGDLRVLNNVLNATERDLEVEEVRRFELIESQIGNKEVVLRLIQEEDEQFRVNLIKFVVDDRSICEL